MPERPPPVLAIVGATATGKSTLAIAVTRALAGEVVNADSMQLYRGMDIGTAKVSAAERQAVPHHLLDVWPVTRTASVAAYQSMAREVIDSLRARFVTPVLVGGSGLYVRAALDDLDFPGTDPEIRAALEAELSASGPELLHERLTRRDPVAAQLIPATNGRRIVRALEVVALRGSYTAQLPAGREINPTVRIGLDVPRDVLDARIEARVTAMWDAGFVDEVRGLAARGLRDGVTASRALGYAQVLRHLDDPATVSDADARDETIRLTRRFARRQLSWFRRDPITWLPYDAPDLCDRALQVVRSSPRGDQVVR